MRTFLSITRQDGDIYQKVQYPSSKATSLCRTYRPSTIICSLKSQTRGTPLFHRIYKYSRIEMEVPPRFELGIRELQSHALPLGYGTKWILIHYIAYISDLSSIFLSIRLKIDKIQNTASGILSRGGAPYPERQPRRICRRSWSAIIEINSELVGFPFTPEMV